MKFVIALAFVVIIQSHLIVTLDFASLTSFIAFITSLLITIEDSLIVSFASFGSSFIASSLITIKDFDVTTLVIALDS